MKKLSLLASLLDDHVTPRILAAEVRRTLQNKEKCFTDSESLNCCVCYLDDIKYSGLPVRVAHPQLWRTRDYRYLKCRLFIISRDNFCVRWFWQDLLNTYYPSCMFHRLSTLYECKCWPHTKIINSRATVKLPIIFPVHNLKDSHIT